MNKIPVFGTEASIPLSCGGLVFDFISEFKDPGLGVSFRYVGTDNSYADAILYDLGLPIISQDIRSAEMRQEFQDAYASILLAVERGFYHSFETHKAEFLHIPDNAPEPFCLWSAFSYYKYSESDNDFTKKRTSHLTLRTDRGFINKIRYTYPSYKDMNEQAEFAGFGGFIAFLLEWTKTVWKFSSDGGIVH